MYYKYFLLNIFIHFFMHNSSVLYHYNFITFDIDIYFFYNSAYVFFSKMYIFYNWAFFNDFCDELIIIGSFLRLPFPLISDVSAQFLQFDIISKLSKSVLYEYWQMFSFLKVIFL